MGVDASFHRSPVIACGKQDRIYPIHNALIVGHRPTWIQLGHATGLTQAFGQGQGLLWIGVKLGDEQANLGFD